MTFDPVTFDYDKARQTMVDTQVRTNDVTNPLVVAAMRSVPREAMSGAAPHMAYADGEVNYAPGCWLLRPRDVGKLLQALDARPGERALAIAAPYAAAVLAHMGLTVEESDGSAPVAGPYDVIVSEGAVATAPSAWLDGLALGGRLGVVERTGPGGKAMIFLRTADGIGARTVFDSAAPLLAGAAPAPVFAF